MRYSVSILWVVSVLVPASGFAAVWYVYEDGTGDFSTISEAITTAPSADSILVGCGIYNEPDLNLGWNSSYPQDYPDVLGLAGDPECVSLSFRLALYNGATIRFEGVKFVEGSWIRCNGRDDYGNDAGTSYRATGCIFENAQPSATDLCSALFDVCIFRNSIGQSAAACNGGNVSFHRCTFENNTAPDAGAAFHSSGNAGYTSFIDCRFINNSAGTDGGALAMGGIGWTDSWIDSCLFEGNTAGGDGGAVYSNQSRTLIYNSLFAGNSAVQNGGAVAVVGHKYQSNGWSGLLGCTLQGNTSAPGSGAISFVDSVLKMVIGTTIIAGSTSGSAVFSSDVVPYVFCSDFWGNSDGDWVGGVADSLSVNDNFSAH